MGGHPDFIKHYANYAGIFKTRIWGQAQDADTLRWRTMTTPVRDLDSSGGVAEVVVSGGPTCIT